MLGHAEGTAGFALSGYTHNFGNHVAAALDQDFVADLDAEPGDLVLVVEGRARDGDTTHWDWLQMRDGGKSAGAANLHADVLDGGGRLPGGVLVGDRPARGFRCPSELSLQRDGIHFDDDAVDLVRQGLALR